MGPSWRRLERGTGIGHSARAIEIFTCAADNASLRKKETERVRKTEHVAPRCHNRRIASSCQLGGALPNLDKESAAHETDIYNTNWDGIVVADVQAPLEPPWECAGLSEIVVVAAVCSEIVVGRARLRK